MLILHIVGHLVSPHWFSEVDSGKSHNNRSSVGQKN